MASASTIEKARREYRAAKGAYKKAGARAMGKPKSGKPYKEYQLAKRVYHTLGRQLGKMTGLKPRKSRR